MKKKPNQSSKKTPTKRNAHFAQRNQRLQSQRRKMLGKHYAAKYGAR